MNQLEKGEKTRTLLAADSVGFLNVPLKILLPLAIDTKNSGSSATPS